MIHPTRTREEERLLKLTTYQRPANTRRSEANHELRSNDSRGFRA